MQCVIQSDPRAGAWITTPLQDMHQSTSRIVSYKSSQGETDDGDPLLSAAGSHRAAAGIIEGDSVEETTSTGKHHEGFRDGDEGAQRSRGLQEMVISFVTQSGFLSALQSLTALASASFARVHLLHRPALSTGIVICGTVLVASGCLLLERGDSGLHFWSDLFEDSEDTDIVPGDAGTVGAETGRDANGSVVVLACHSESVRSTGLGLLVFGFGFSLAPLLVAEADEQTKPKLMACLSLLGSGLCTTAMGMVQEWQSAPTISQGREILAPEEQTTNAALARNATPLHLRWMRWIRLTLDTLPVKASWVVLAFAGALSSVVLMGIRPGAVSPAWERTLMAAMKPASLLVMYSADLKNKYHSSRLRVFCPGMPAEGSGCRSICMWEKQKEVLRHDALSRQMSCLQTKSFLLTSFVTIMPSEYSIPFVIGRALMTDGVIRNVLFPTQ